MKILVYDVAAEDGGGLQVLKSFYADALRHGSEQIEWVFLVSTDVLEDAPGIAVQRYKKVKKSWLHRLAFEHLELPGIIREQDPDLLISLQNMPVKRCRRRQFVYLHQSLQFCPKRFSFLKGEERSLAVRQRIIGRIMKDAMPRAEHIFVQTRWVREATRKWLCRPEADITVVPVALQDDVPAGTPYDRNARVFFYPAQAYPYKNHQVILAACRLLEAGGITDYRVVFTIDPEDGGCGTRLCREAAGLPAEFIGAVPHEQIWAHYSRSVLIFPSYLETCGLPLLEAKGMGARILASDMPFSHEALDGYPNVRYFRYDDPEELADQMKALLEGRTGYMEPERASNAHRTSLLEAMLSRI